MEREFSTGPIFSKSFDIFGQNFSFMAILGFMATVPTFLTALAPQNTTLAVLVMPITFLITYLIQGVVVYGVFQHLTGQKVNLGDSFNVALKRLGYLILVAMATGFLTMLGLVFLIIPGIIISLMLWVAIPVTMVEKGGVGHALQRSRELTTGYRLQIFGITFLAGLIAALATGIQYGLIAASGAMGMVPGSLAANLVSLPIMVLTTGLAASLNSVIVTVSYYNLRQDVEGVATEDLASVFE
ncbi:MAG: hypothetical protein QNL91_15555 [Candidatus Krumholzibacteria bacterium]|nr:hypothetical protein [Candidatus Krumholzibacteria bacterium]